MSVSNVTNTPDVQSQLAALTSASQLLQQTEQQLVTGQSVTLANATAYYAAQGFLQQANDLSNLKSNLATSLSTVNSTTDSISSAEQVVQQLQGIVTEASSTTDVATRAGLASQYNALLPQLDQLVNDSTFNGTNLLNSTSNDLTVYFDASNTSSVTISGVNITSSGLNLTSASNNFATTADLNSASSQLQSALSTLGSAAASFGSNATLIETNQDFTSNLVNNLQDASSNLTIADTNQEGASLLALQSQNQLGVISLGISGQLSQSILRLFP